MNTNILINDTKISVQHSEVDGDSLDAASVLIESYGAIKNTLTTITINNTHKVTVAWENHSSVINFDALYVEDTDTLFVGGGDLSGSFHVKGSRIIELNRIDLFWGFQRHGEFVLELGELECFLYNLSGKLVDKTRVDPPYDMEIGENEIVFKSPVMGTTKLQLIG